MTADNRRGVVVGSIIDKQTRHASGQLGWMHFGLGQALKVKLRVQWPQGNWGPWQEVAANNFYIVDRQAGTNLWKAP